MTFSLFCRSRLKKLLIPLALVTVGLVHVVIENEYRIRNTISYATRPLWDRKDGPSEVISHYYGEGMKMDGHACKLHGWSERQGKEMKVMDAILMSSEIDLLEIRMNELNSVVDHFFIVESNATFTGLRKERHFANHRGRFSEFEKKIVYRFLPGYQLAAGGSPWENEAAARDEMTGLLRSHIPALAGEGTESLVVMSDVDEIPSRHTIALLKACDFGRSLHLQLRNFLYSFEWQVDMGSWRASVHLWDREVRYRHSKSGERVLADSGWHCSYCFRTIAEYVAKMQGFSHSDRIGGNPKLLEPTRIQDVICHGKNIFGMLPEAYTYLDLLSQITLSPLKTAVGLPAHLINNADKFRFLLPGGCIRES